MALRGSLCVRCRRWRGHAGLHASRADRGCCGERHGYKLSHRNNLPRHLQLRFSPGCHGGAERDSGGWSNHRDLDLAREYGRLQRRFGQFMHGRAGYEPDDHSDFSVTAAQCIVRYSASSSNFPNVVLCFAGFSFLCGTTFPAGGAPMRSRANSLTACTARNRFTFFLRAICLRTFSFESWHSCCHSL